MATKRPAGKRATSRKRATGKTRTTSRAGGKRKRGPSKKRAPAKQTASAATDAGPPLDAHRLTTKDAADRLGLTDRRLQQLALEDPDIPCVGHGKRRRWLWPALREWRDRQLVQQGVRSIRPQTLDEARTRKLAAEADLKEIELAERRGALMPSALFRQEFEGACARIRAHQLNAPARYAPQLLAAFADRLRTDDLEKVEQFLERMMQEQMAELEAGEDVPEDEEESNVA